MISNSPKSKVVAALLCFFLGGLGIHRFYLGYTLIGVIQLVTFGGCGIWALIDFILILVGSLKDRDGQDLE
jgi:TM2 domain-containing membrane protein YozV